MINYTQPSSTLILPLSHLYLALHCKTSSSLLIYTSTHNFMSVEKMRASCPNCDITSKHSSNSEATDDRGLDDGEETSEMLLGRACIRTSRATVGLQAMEESELCARVLVSREEREEREEMEGLDGRVGRRRVNSGIGLDTNW